MRLSGRVVDQVFFFLLLLAVSLAFFELIADFLKVIFWAAVLAMMFRPVHLGLLRLMPRWPGSAALVSTFAVVFAVLVPLMLIGFAVAQEAANLAQDFEAGDIDLQATLRWLQQRIPFLPDLLNRFELNVQRIQEGLAAAAVAAGQWIATNAVTIGQNTLQFLLHLFVMLYLLFFFIKDGGLILQAIGRIVPFDFELQQHLRARFAAVARATLKGTFLISVIQGTVGGLTFWLLDLRAPVLWGVVMTLFALLPAIGPPIVWIPAAVLLMASGEILKGIILIGVGGLIIGLVDNILRPVLVGRDARLPDYIILLTTLGGIAAFGISGVVIGPIIAALFFAVWTAFADRRQTAAATATGEEQA